MQNLTYLRSGFRQYMPPAKGNYIAEAAYDIWLNNWDTELMIWVDNHGQVPAGKVVGTYTIYGEKWQLWQDGSVSSARACSRTGRNDMYHRTQSAHWW